MIDRLFLNLDKSKWKQIKNQAIEMDKLPLKN